MLIQATGDIVTHVDMYHQLKSKLENFTAHHLSINHMGRRPGPRPPPVAATAAEGAVFAASASSSSSGRD